MKYLLSLGVALLALVTACGDRTTIINPSGPSATPTPSPNASGQNVIEFRVNGNANFANVKYSFPTDGLTLVTTVLPYDIDFNTNLNTIFVSLEATPTSYPATVVVPFISVQIFANGVLFREATSSSFLLTTVTVSGTWRR